MKTINIDGYLFEIELGNMYAKFRGKFVWNGRLELSNADNASYEVTWNSVANREKTIALIMEKLIGKIVKTLQGDFVGC